MKRLFTNLTILATLGLLSTSTFAAEPDATASSDQWLGFRGNSTSVATTAGPDQLGLGADGNLAWKLEMPGRSVAGPIVIGDLVVTTGSSGQSGEDLHVSGVNLTTGKLLWEQEFRATGRPYCHPTSANAAPTPVSDGQRIFAFFSSNDLICLSIDGDLLWYRGLGHDYPHAGNDVGMASSPIVVDGTVIVQVEAQGDSFAIGIDTKSGQNLWRIDRPQDSNWSSPVVIQRPDDRTEVILQSSDKIIAIDPRTGKQSWDSSVGGSSVESSTATDELLLVPGNELTALNFGESATAPEVAWSNSKLAPKNASAVATKDRVYALKGSVLVAANISDGEIAWRERLSGLGGTWATPAYANGKLYIFDQKGVGMVVEDQGDKAKTISKVELEEPVLASPALAKGRLIIRGDRTLYCFE